MYKNDICPKCGGSGRIPMWEPPKDAAGNVLTTEVLGEDGQWTTRSYPGGPDKLCGACEGSGVS